MYHIWYSESHSFALSWWGGAYFIFLALWGGGIYGISASKCKYTDLQCKVHEPSYQHTQATYRVLQ